MKGRFILESVVYAYEIIHETTKSNKKGIVLKFDYEKAYDRVNWNFLEEMMVSRGFGPKWVKWVMSLVKNGSIAIRLNDKNNGFFRPGKGLRQGDPLSPLLFNLVVDVFTRMLVRAAQGGHITGLMTSLYLEGVISLQYADDTLIFLEHDNVAACHLKCLSVCY
jgi:retron-type reverse transcriptase